MAVAFIPLRGGSKSIPLKNIKLFSGKPLCYWVIEALQQAVDISKIIVATDSEAIKDTVNSFSFSKVEVYDRDAANAEDTSSTEAVMLEYLNKYSLPANDYFILVQATNPFITTDDLDKSLSMLEEGLYDSLLTCVRYKRFFWNEDGTPKNYDYKKRPRRQDFAGELMENGAFYIAKVGDIITNKNRLGGKVGVYEMPEYSAYEIDEPDDWIIMERLFEKHLKNKVGVNKESSKSIKLFISDVDGVMTDAGMYYSNTGDELKKFNTHDGMGFSILKAAGVKTGIVTSETTAIVENRAKKLKLDCTYQGMKHQSKLDAALEICKQESISIEEVAYIGDDINCFELLSSAGIAACPANAVSKIKNIPGIIHLSKKGGEGAVREFIDLLFERQLIGNKAVVAGVEVKE